MKNLKLTKILTVCVIALTSWTTQAQDFPILLHSNGADAFVESMEVGPDGDIYVTGRIGVWNQFTLGACAGTDVVFPFLCPWPTTVHQQDIFVARFHPDDSDPALNDLVWLVRGRSSIDPSPDVHSGKDLEIDGSGNVFFAGTLTGDVNFTRVFPICDFPTTLNCCPSTNMTRSFVGKISAAGVPEWVADTKIMGSFGSTYGEAITLDPGHNRLFTGGYVSTAASGSSVYMRNSDCTDECDFFAVPEPSGNVGFIAEYDLVGNNYRGGILGERVMALTMGQVDEHVWATGSTYGADLDVMLADVHMDVIDEPCINFSINYFGIFGAGDDVGLDIGQANDGSVVFTGVFTNALDVLPPVGIGNTDIFVASFNGGLNFTSTSIIPGGIPTVSSMPWQRRSSCIDAEDITFGSNRMIIGYNADDFGLIETQELYTNLTPVTDVNRISPTVLDGDHSRAMEINYGTSGWDGKRYMAGDIYHHTPMVTGYDFEGVCTIGVSGTHYEGYITQLDGMHDQTEFILETDEPDKEMGIELFPNPAEDQVTLRIENDGVSLKMFDGKGRLLLEKSNLSSGEHTIDVNTFTPGVYLLEISSDEGNFTTKLIVN